MSEHVLSPVDDLHLANPGPCRYRVTCSCGYSTPIRVLKMTAQQDAQQHQASQPAPQARSLVEAIALAFYGPDSPRWTWDMDALNRAAAAARGWEWERGWRE